jgi:hypothetical protein
MNIAQNPIATAIAANANHLNHDFGTMIADTTSAKRVGIQPSKNIKNLLCSGNIWLCTFIDRKIKENVTLMPCAQYIFLHHECQYWYLFQLKDHFV